MKSLRVLRSGDYYKCNRLWGGGGGGQGCMSCVIWDIMIRAPRMTLIKYDLGGIILVILTDAILDQARNFMTNKGQFETQSEHFLVTPHILQ